MVTIRADYAERVYAGVLGKIIGVYVGRPFEGWTHERILAELGEIQYYVHERLGKPLVVTDDDISGTFTFLRAMADYGNTLGLTAAQIGQSWLNYLIEERTILWWGGMGNSTEHTAYLRLKAGIPAPESGAMARNGQVVAEQIGAQIFIDGWGMISPGDPAQAAELARRAGSVSHDGEAIYGAQVIAAMAAQAFVERDIMALLDVGMGVIPHDSLIYRLIGDLRDWRGRYATWQESFYRVAANYGYDRYGGNCHMIPNHALVILALLYCEDSFQRAMTIVNTAGWDTDCNSANVGCLMGIKNGLAGLDAGPDYRGPVADRLYLPTADGGRAVSDAVHEADEIVAMGRALAGLPAARPKNGARFHFDQPGAVQGWRPDGDPASAGTTMLENAAGHSACGGRSLAIHYRGVAPGRPARALHEVYPDYEEDRSHGYSMVACPTLYAGQTVRARLEADAANAAPVTARLFARAYGAGDGLLTIAGPAAELAPGAAATLAWPVEAPGGCPLAWIGVEISTPGTPRADGTVYLDWLTWDGAPDVTLAPPTHAGGRWLEVWVQACDVLTPDGDGHHYRLIQNEGTGLALQGTREWRDYAVSATVTPHLAATCGLAAYVQGLRRYLALELVPGGARLVRELDGTHVLAEAPLDWRLDGSYRLELAVGEGRVIGRIDGRELFSLPAGEALQGQPEGNHLSGGAIALLVAEGRAAFDDVAVRPL